MFCKKIVRARAIALACGLLLAILIVAGKPAAAGQQQAQAGLAGDADGKPTFLAVVGFETSARTPEESSFGAALGQELTTRLAMDSTHLAMVERLQLNEILAARGVVKCMLDLGHQPGAVGQEDPEGKPAAEALRAELAQTGDSAQRRLYGADYLLLGFVRCGEKSLVADTRLDTVANGVVRMGVTAEVKRTPEGLEHDLQDLAVALTVKWCEKLGVQVTAEMTRVSEDKPGLYLAWCQAQEHLLRGEFEQCEQVASEALRTVPGDRLLEALSETRDLAYERLIDREKPGSAAWQKWVDENISKAEAALGYARALKTVAAYYAGRAQERAGNLEAAENLYRECLCERPTRVLWDYEAGGDIGTPVVTGQIAYAGSKDGYLRAFDAKTGKVLWGSRAEGRIDTPVVVDGVAYAGSDDHLLRAFDATTGKLLWSFDSECATWPRPIVVSEGVVCTVFGEEHFRSFDANTGKLLWKFDTDKGVAAWVITGHTALVASEDQHLRAFEAGTGQLLWDAGTPYRVDSLKPVDGIVFALLGYVRAGDALGAYEIRSGRLLWGVKCEGIQAPVVAGGLVYTGADDDHLRAFVAQTGKLVWDRKLQSYETPPVVDGVVYATENGDLRALDARTGKLQWHFQADKWTGTPAVVDGVAYAYDSSHLRAFDAKTGQALWAVVAEGGDDRPLIADGAAYCRSADNHLRAFDAETGNLLFDFVSRNLFHLPAVFSGIAYAGSMDHHLRAFDTAKPAGPDYAERATGRLMQCLANDRQSAEALRLGARLCRETTARAPETSRALQAAASEAWPELAEARMGLHPRLGSHAGPPQLSWDLALGETGPAARSVSLYGLVLSDGVAYAGWDDGRVQAIDTAKGTVLWEVSVTSLSRAPVIANGVVFATGYEGMTALAAKTGKILWRSAALCLDPPVIVNGVGYAAAFENGGRYAPAFLNGHHYLRAFDPSTGKVLWDFEDEGMMGTPVVADGVAFVASPGSDIQAIDTRTGKQLWAVNAVLGMPAVADGTIFVCRWNGDIRALEAATGKLRWSFPTAEGLDQPVPANGAVYAGSEDGHLRALSAQSGKLLWDFDAGNKVLSPTVVKGVVYTVSYNKDTRFQNQKYADHLPEDGHLYALDARTGKPLWHFAVGQGIDTLPAVRDGLVFAPSKDNHVRVFDAHGGKLLFDYEAGAAVCVQAIGSNALYYVGSDDGHVCAFDVAEIKAGVAPKLTWCSDVQFWSYLIWGKGGLAVRKVADGVALNQILKYDTWSSADALAVEIDRLARLAEQPNRLGDWDGRLALSLDPATLCPPELKVVQPELSAQGVRPAAQFYLWAARRDDPSSRVRLEYAREALRLAPGWAEAKRLLTRPNKADQAQP
ncbi:MAG: PQQ-binding-like beta-propeller repeat protein [Armatimonadia bacterium]